MIFILNLGIPKGQNTLVQIYLYVIFPIYILISYILCCHINSYP